MAPQEVVDLFEAALKQPGWIDDKVPDQFPRVQGKKDSGMPPPGSDSDGANANRGKKRGFSKSLGVDLEQLPEKRRRADELFN